MPKCVNIDFYQNNLPVIQHGQVLGSISNARYSSHLDTPTQRLMRAKLRHTKAVLNYLSIGSNQVRCEPNPEENSKNGCNKAANGSL
jgi:hypothetical protein